MISTTTSSFSRRSMGVLASDLDAVQYVPLSPGDTQTVTGQVDRGRSGTAGQDPDVPHLGRAHLAVREPGDVREVVDTTDHVLVEELHDLLVIREAIGHPHRGLGEVLPGEQVIDLLVVEGHLDQLFVA